jgi:3'(2'), 5'-bisphosphate nucleotidase
MATEERKAALQAAELACTRIMELYGGFVAIPDAPSSISTQADAESQEIILATLYAAFPGDAFIGEEDTPLRRKLPFRGRRLWVVDPIDGTRGFAQKNGEFSVMIALCVEGESVVGVVAEPAKGRLTWAEKGHGCWAVDAGGAERRCRVRDTRRLEEAILVQSRSRPGAGPSPAARALHPARVDETHSAGVKMARVARGDADLYVNDYPRFNDWDIAAGHVIVTEAGGLVSGVRGEEIKYGLEGNRQASGLLAASAVLHGPALERLRGAF